MSIDSSYIVTLDYFSWSVGLLDTSVTSKLQKPLVSNCKENFEDP